MTIVNRQHLLLVFMGWMMMMNVLVAVLAQDECSFTACKLRGFENLLALMFFLRRSRFIGNHFYVFGRN